MEVKKVSLSCMDPELTKVSVKLSAWEYIIYIYKYRNMIIIKNKIKKFKI